MAAGLDNRRRVRPAGLGSRAGAAAFHIGCLHSLVVIGAATTGLAELLVSERADGVVRQRAMIAAGTLAIGLAVLSTAWVISRRAPGQRLFGTRVVDARTYRPVGAGRLLLRVVARDAQIGAALWFTRHLARDHLPTDDLRALWFVLAWALACYATPLVFAFFMPRSRAPHDWLARTVVIEADEFSRRPQTVPVLVGAPKLRSA